ncbi:MAG: FkbM family methyltransferase [Verrucomicrobiaceae bacterium]|jgi:FkbM family methyltransferase
MKGKMRLARAVMTRAMPDRAALIRVDGLQFQVPSTREPVAMHLIADGAYESDLCTALRKVLHPDSVFLDVGANVGVLSIFAAHRWCPQGTVLGFEASPQIFEHLTANVQANPHRALDIVHAAVTSHSGDTLTFFNAPDSKFGMGSLSNRFNTEGIAVPTVALDDAVRAHGIDRIRAIKIDVEGFELGVFQGATQILTQPTAPVVFFEFNDWAENRPEQGIRAGDAQRFLLSLGYQLQRLDEYIAGGPLNRNVIESGGTDLVAIRIAL